MKWHRVLTAVALTAFVCHEAYGQEPLWTVRHPMTKATYSGNGRSVSVEYNEPRNEERSYLRTIIHDAEDGRALLTLDPGMKVVVGVDFVFGDSIIAYVWVDTTTLPQRLIIETVDVATGLSAPVVTSDIEGIYQPGSFNSVSSNGDGWLCVLAACLNEQKKITTIKSLIDVRKRSTTSIPVTNIQGMRLRHDTIAVRYEVQAPGWNNTHPSLLLLQVPTMDTLAQWDALGNGTEMDFTFRANGAYVLHGNRAIDPRSNISEGIEVFAREDINIGGSGWALHPVHRPGPNRDVAFQRGYVIRDMHGRQLKDPWFAQVPWFTGERLTAVGTMLDDGTRYCILNGFAFRIPKLSSVAENDISVDPRTTVVPCNRFICRSMAGLRDNEASYAWSIEGGPWIETPVLDTILDRPLPYIVRLRTTYADGSSDTVTRALADPLADTNVISVSCGAIRRKYTNSAITYHEAAKLLIYNNVTSEDRPAYFRTTPPTIRQTTEFDALGAMAAWAPDGQPYLFTLHENTARSTPVYYVASIVRRDIHTGAVIDSVCHISLGRPHAFTRVGGMAHGCFYAPGRGRMVLNMSFGFIDTLAQPPKPIATQTRLIRIDPERGTYLSNTPYMPFTGDWSTFIEDFGYVGFGPGKIRVLDLAESMPSKIITHRANGQFVDDRLSVRDSVDLDGLPESWTYRQSDGQYVRRLRSTRPLRLSEGSTSTAHTSSAYWIPRSVCPTIPGGIRHLGPFIDLDADTVVHSFGALAYEQYPSDFYARSVTGATMFLETGTARYVIRVPNETAVKLRIDPVSVEDTQQTDGVRALTTQHSIASASDRIVFKVPTDGTWSVTCVDLLGQTMYRRIQQVNDGLLTLETDTLPLGTFAFYCTSERHTTSLLLLRNGSGRH